MGYFIEFLPIVANLSSIIGIFTAFFIYWKTRRNEIKDNKKEIEMKNKLVFTEVRNICTIYSHIINEMRELSEKAKNIKATTIDGNIKDNKYLFLLITNENDNVHHSISIIVNNYGRLNDMLFHGLLLSHEANEALRLTIYMCEIVNDYIASVYQKIIFSDRLPMSAKIFTLEGYSSTKVYDDHRAMIRKALEITITK